MKGQFERDAELLLAYILSSAAGCVKEPKIYGAFRLAETAERLILLFAKHKVLVDKDMIDIAEQIASGKLLCMNDMAGFVSMLDSASEKMATVISK
jgi:hypothetical protein